MSRSALIVFARIPDSGSVKTRLEPAVGTKQTAALYEAFVDDLLARFRWLDVHIRLYVDGDTTRVPKKWRNNVGGVFRQRGVGLGVRMWKAFEETFRNGFNRIIIVGTDAPTLPEKVLGDGFEFLKSDNAIVLGPAEDGGYYALGMSAACPELFERMTYSHAEVFERTMQRAKKISDNILILPTWYDVDTPAALRRLIRDSSGLARAPRTRSLLARLRESRPDWM